MHFGSSLSHLHGHPRVCGLFPLILLFCFLLYLPHLFLFLNYLKSVVNLHNSCNESVDSTDEFNLSTHPDVVGAALSGTEAPSTRAVLECGAALREAKFEMPTWAELADGARPNQPENPEDEPADSTHGCQLDATLKLVTKFFQEELWSRLSEPEQAQMRSQSGPMSSEPFTSFSNLTGSALRFPALPCSPSPSPPSPPSSHRPVAVNVADTFGHHR